MVTWFDKGAEKTTSDDDDEFGIDDSEDPILSTKFKRQKKKNLLTNITALDFNGNSTQSFGTTPINRDGVIKTATFVRETVITEDGFPTGIRFEEGGFRALMSGGASDTIFSFTLTEAYNWATRTQTGSTFIGGGRAGFDVTKDGKDLYVVENDGNTVDHFTLPVAWNADNLTLVDTLPAGTLGDNAPIGVKVHPLKTKLFVLGDQTTSLREFDITNGLATATFTGSFPITQNTVPSGLDISGDGKVVWVSATGVDSVSGLVADVLLELQMPNAWSIGGMFVLPNNVFDVSLHTTDVRGICITEDMTKFFFAATDTDAILQFELGLTSKGTEVSRLGIKINEIFDQGSFPSLPVDGVIETFSLSGTLTGYNDGESITLSGGTGASTKGTATFLSGIIASLTALGAGSGDYIDGEDIILNSFASGTGATATATIVGGFVTGIVLTGGGSLYGLETLQIKGVTSGATSAPVDVGSITAQIESVTLTNRGFDYTGSDSLVITGDSSANNTGRLDVDTIKDKVLKIPEGQYNFMDDVVFDDGITLEYLGGNTIVFQGMRESNTLLTFSGTNISDIIFTSGNVSDVTFRNIRFDLTGCTNVTWLNLDASFIGWFNMTVSFGTVGTQKIATLVSNQTLVVDNDVAILNPNLGITSTNMNNIRAFNMFVLFNGDAGVWNIDALSQNAIFNANNYILTEATASIFNFAPSITTQQISIEDTNLLPFGDPAAQFYMTGALTEESPNVITDNCIGSEDSMRVAEIGINSAGGRTITVVGTQDTVFRIENNPPVTDDFTVDVGTQEFSVDTATGVVTYIGLKRRTFLIIYEIIQFTTPSPSQILDIIIQINGLEQDKTIRTMNTASATEKIYPGGIFTLDPGDTINLAKNNTSNANTTTFERLALVITGIK